ncbi:hypothetical protein ANAEL_01594 [Anaerolineales bacterium]|nr:hypothetical protein ANAEL_01594 [Anaerolineales bacterium]
MKNKFLSILISVPVLSLITFAVAVFVVLSAGVNSPGDPIGANLVPALVIGFGLVVLVWLGAGFEFVLARIRNKLIRIVAAFGVFILAPAFLCVGLPALVLFIGASLFSSPPSWKALPPMPDKPTEIVAADHITVYVNTASGNTVKCFVTQPSSCWQPTTKPSTRVLVSNVNQREISSAPASEPPSKTVSILGVAYEYCCGGPKKEIHYALLADGSVWYVDRETSNTTPTFVGMLVLPFIVMLSLAGLGMIYLGAGVNALSRRLADKHPAVS